MYRIEKQYFRSWKGKNSTVLIKKCNYLLAMISKTFLSLIYMTSEMNINIIKN